MYLCVGVNPINADHAGNTPIICPGEGATSTTESYHSNRFTGS